MPTPLEVFQWFETFWVVIVTPIAFVYFMFIYKPTYGKPDGYVGQFRRLDGKTVHVSRVNGRLMVASVEPPGVMPLDLGNVSGRELAKWEKLAAR